MGKSAPALLLREKEVAEIIWGCLQERKDYVRDYHSWLKRGVFPLLPIQYCTHMPNQRFLQKYGIAHPINPKTSFSGYNKEIIIACLRTPHIRNLTLHHNGLDKSSGFKFLESLEKMIQSTKKIELEIELTGKKEVLLKEFGKVVDEYQKYLEKTPANPKHKGGEITAAKKRLRAFKLYKELKSYSKTAARMVEEGFFKTYYIQQFPEDAKRDTMRLVKEAKVLIDGGYKKLR